MIKRIQQILFQDFVCFKQRNQKLMLYDNTRNYNVKTTPSKVNTFKKLKYIVFQL